MLLYINLYHKLKSPLTVEQFKVLLNVEYDIDTDHKQDENLALRCIRQINNVSANDNGAIVCIGNR